MDAHGTAGHGTHPGRCPPNGPQLRLAAYGRFTPHIFHQSGYCRLGSVVWSVLAPCGSSEPHDLVMSDVSPAERDYVMLLDRVRAAESRLAAVPVHGAVGSPIEADNQYLSRVPIAQSFQYFIGLPLRSALDNLGLIAETLHTVGARHLFAENSLIRTALTAASFAFWMADEDDANKRRARVLRFVFKDLDGLDMYVRNSSTADSPTLPLLIEALADLKQLIVKHADVLEGTSGTKVNEYKRSGPSDTAVLGYAGVVTGASEVQRTWQLMSGYVHALPWPAVLSSMQTATHNPVHGITIPTFVPNVRQILDASHLALTVIDCALTRFEVLSCPP